MHWDCCRRQALEANVSAQQYRAQAAARLSLPYEIRRWEAYSVAAPGKGTQTPLGLDRWLFGSHI